MATKQVIRELVTLWGFEIDSAPLKEVDAGINTIKQSLKGLLVTTASAAAGVGLLLREAGTDEQTRIAFETMLGSAEAMEQKLRELEEFAVKTPFTLKGVKENTQLLLGMGISADSLLPTLKALGDVSAGLSVPLWRLALNYGQVRSQQKLTGRELRDFAVAGVPLLEELAKNLGKTTEEISSMISAGDISFADTEKAFITMTSEGGKFANLMDKQSRSLFGVLSNIQDVIQLIARDLGNELLPEAKRIANQVMEWLQANEKLIKQNLGEFFKNLAELIGDLFNMMQALLMSISGIVKVFGGWNKVLKITMKLLVGILGTGFLLGVGLMSQGVFKLAMSFWGLVVALGATIAKMFLLNPITGTFAFSLKALGDSALIAQAKLFLIPAAIGAIMVAIGLIAEDIFAFSQGRNSVFGLLLNGIDKVIDELKGKFGILGTFLNIVLAGILSPIRAIVISFRTIGTMIDVLMGKISVLEGLKQGVGNIGSFFTPFAGGANSNELFGLPEKFGQIDESINAGSSSAITGLGGSPFKSAGDAQKAVSVSARNEINLNVTGMDTETAKDLVTTVLGEELSFMLRSAVRDGESTIER